MTNAILFDNTNSMGFENEFRKLFKGAIGRFFETQTEMSAKTGINQGSLSELLSGKKKSLQLETVGKFLDAIGARLLLPDELPSDSNKNMNNIKELQEKIDSLTKTNVLYEKLNAEYEDKIKRLESERPSKKERPKDQEIYTGPDITPTATGTTAIEQNGG